MKNILVAGGTGLVGNMLTKKLKEKGYEVGILSRKVKNEHTFKYFKWDPENDFIDPAAIEFADALINLSGENVATRWTEEQKFKITESRTKSNALLINECNRLNKWPKVCISAGGMNYYGSRGDEDLNEASRAGNTGFLPQSCIAWENSVDEWRKHNVRTVQFRISLVLSTKGGAFPKLMMSRFIRILPLFGDGNQWYSWIHIEDLCSTFIHALENQTMNTVYNAASPEPLRLKDFLKISSNAYQTPSLIIPIPAWIFKLVLGEMSETVLSSVRLNVDKIKGTGFEWKYPRLFDAVKNLVNSKE